MPNETDLVGFTPGLRLRLEAGDHLIKTAESAEEVSQAQRLRYEVFYRELFGRANPSQMDSDRFDAICDHMLVLEPRSGRLLGTYRLYSSGVGDYRARRVFAIESILRLEGNKLEVGRGCVAKQRRSQNILILLWKGIAEYLRRTSTRYIFGCSSLPAGASSQDIAMLHNYVLRHHYSSEERRVYPFKPLPACAAGALHPASDMTTGGTAVQRLCPLLFFYLHAGAVICGEPAFDEEDQTYDFFTLLDLQALTQAGYKLFRAPDHGSFGSVKAFMRE
jgi:putative hemolysin